MEAANNGVKNFKDSEAYAAARDMAKEFSIKDYSELSDIRKDLDSLKDNVVALTRHLKNDGAETAGHIKDSLAHSAQALRTKGENGLEALDGKIKDNPRSSVLVAFAAGVIANFLLRRG